MDRRVARAMWTVFEPVHALAYFAPLVRARFDEAGVRGFWRSYFAGRAAPLGVTEPEVVQAAFFSFAPAMVERAIPSVWDLIDPDTAWAIRSTAASEVLAACVEAIDRDDLDAANRILRSVVDHLDPGGRLFFAAHLRLTYPPDPVAGIWHACTLLREHRGDGHIAAALGEGLSALDLLVLTDKADLTPAGHATDNRGWSAEQWAERVGHLQETGLIDPSGSLTPAGQATRAVIEARTDAAALGAWSPVCRDDLRFVHRCLREISRAVTDLRGYLSYPNPIGVPTPDDEPFPDL